MDDERPAEIDEIEIVPKKQSLFPISADDIVDNALQNLTEAQAHRVTEKAADEMVRLAVEKRKAEYRNEAAQGEMQSLINNANLLDQRVGDYKINSTFETASGTTNVEIRKSPLNPTNLILIVGIVIVILVVVVLYFAR
ncbi:MAG: hypothetical protein KA746_03005 [Pyrinomonadaceae bacterium]|nr:hypothetical protein [Pyrinomonadaceae bacterium]MBP6212845.1 hypothetical protein [Pyrinomonadaceae bacterium]